jgi:hypothetical protein
MQFIIVACPTESDLQAYYCPHDKNYEIPERLSFSHVFFSVDRSHEEEARARAERALATLGGGLMRSTLLAAVVESSRMTTTQGRRIVNR